MEDLKEVGAGLVGVVRLARDHNNDLLAIKFIRREKIDRYVEREIINHRSLNHPNIIKFRKVLLTPTHLAIVMEYASGGDLFDRVFNAGRLSEDEARFFFQQLISGVSYCHSKQICHRDLKPENILLDGSALPQLKICDFGYSKSTLMESRTKSTVGTTAYVAPEIFLGMPYDGKMADIWSCGATLYVMLFGQLPFEDPKDPTNIPSAVQRAMNAEYSFPRHIGVSAECKNLLSRILVASPDKRITMSEIKRHPWFLQNLKLPMEAANRKASEMTQKEKEKSQSVEEIMQIIQEARMLAPTSEAR